MPGWDDELREVAREFIGGSEERWRNCAGRYEEVERLPTEPRPLSELRRHFHRLAGAAGTFGLGEVSELARAAERLCAQTETHGGGPPEMVRAEWHQVVDRIEAAFRAARCEPATGEDSAASVPAAARNGRQVREAADILVADDDESIRDLLSRLFRQEGLSVRAVGTMADAAAAVDAAMPDGLVVDIELPDGSGYALVEDLRSRPGGDLPPVVMVSLKSGFLDRTEAIHAGADAFFEKPLDWEALVRKLQQLLDRGSAEAPCVLVVEDDADYAAFVRATLESAGYLVAKLEKSPTLSATLALAQNPFAQKPEQGSSSSSVPFSARRSGCIPIEGCWQDFFNTLHRDDGSLVALSGLLTPLETCDPWTWLGDPAMVRSCLLILLSFQKW